MKILFFFTSFSQLKLNNLQSKIFKIQLEDMETLKKCFNLEIDIIIHNNNSEYNKKLIEDSFNVNEFKTIKFINSIEVIHTNKNIGYFWGAHEALSDNFNLFYGYDFVIHLNTSIYIFNLDSLIDYLFNKLNEDIDFFVNIFRNKEGFKTNFSIFRPKVNIFSFYNDEKRKKLLGSRCIPEKMVYYNICESKISFEILPNEYIPISDLSNLKLHPNIDNKDFFRKGNVYHIHDVYSLSKIEKLFFPKNLFVYMFGSCRIEQPLKILQKNNLITGINRDSISNIYNINQLLQNIEIKNYSNLMDIKEDLLLRVLKSLSTYYDFNMNQFKNIFNEKIDLYVIEISSLKNIEYKNISLGTNITADIKYLFNIDFDFIKDNPAPRNLKSFNINNILLLSKNKTGDRYNLYKNTDKNILRNNLNGEIVDNIEFFEDKTPPDFYSFFKKLCEVIENIEYKVQDKDTFFNNLKLVTDILNKPILFIPHWNAKDKDGNYITHRQNINNWLKEYVNTNLEKSLYFVDHSEIFESFSYNDIFKKYIPNQKFEIDRFGIYDTNHLSDKGIKIFSKTLKNFFNYVF